MEAVCQGPDPMVVMISQDSFYRDLSQEQREKASRNQYNFDHPGKEREREEREGEREREREGRGRERESMCILHHCHYDDVSYLAVVFTIVMQL